MTLRLHCFGESGNAYKAALTLALSDLDWEPVLVDFFHGGTRTPEYRALNPMGEVPALETPQGVLTQSAVIQDWVAQQTGRFGWTDDDERRAILRWQLFDNHKVSGVAGPLRFNLNFLPEAKRSEPVNAFLLMRLTSALKVVEAHLTGRDWLALDRPTIADLGLCGYLYYPEPYGFDRADWPAIDAWLDRVAALPGWTHPYDLMPRGSTAEPDARRPHGPPRRTPPMTDAYIYDAIRTPRGKGRPDGSLHEVTAARLSAQVLDGLAERNGLTGHAVEDVIWGNATQVAEQGGCLARTAVLASSLDQRIPGLSINRFCASGMEAVNLAANQIRGGAGDGYIAGGVECMSRVPMGSDGAAIAVDPSIAMETYFVPQGISADIIATEYGFSRDDVDAFAVESQKRAAAAWEANRFDGSILTVRDVNGLTILDRDEYIRPGTDMQSLGALNPAFQALGEVMPGFDKIALMKYPHLERIDHVHTAGNSSGIVDGAAGVLVGSKAFGEKWGLTPRARIRATAKIGTDPTIMLTGPVPATRKILEDSGMEIGDIDLFEVNEAFSSVVLRFMQAFDVDHAKLNPNGGAIAMGHPLGASGAIIIGTLLDEMERTGQGTGLATLCVASGMGAATILERV